MLRSVTVLCLFVCQLQALAQADPPTLNDSTYLLREVIVQGYNYNRPLSEVPAAIGALRSSDLERFNNATLVPAVNTIPGVRMEERSPGSYRLSIRGSALRSPFGVRNVKVYWNDLPFTDPGGNTYLNLFDFGSIDALEAIKGPGSSLYGAGTGGVLLLRNLPAAHTGIEVSTLGGSFGLLRYALKATSSSATANHTVQYSHLQSDGYRQQTATERDVVQMQSRFHAGKNILSLNLLYSDLSYQTPGGLTKAQYEEDPRQARPAGGPNPGAVEQKATIYNETFYVGFSNQYEWSPEWSNQTGIYGTFTKFDNPTIRNYERRAEQSFGGRTNTQYNFKGGRLNFGAEFQHEFSPIAVRDNNLGVSGDLQSEDEIDITTWFVFAQAEFLLPSDLFLTVGAGLNKLDVGFIRLSDDPPTQGERNFKAVFSPRIALLKKFGTALSVYANFSRGYSPPTIQELYPSAGYFDREIDPEQGGNIEAGLRGNLLNKTITYDLTGYVFNMENTIVIRRTQDDAEYFINAGKTDQKGLEAQVAWTPTLGRTSSFTDVRIWANFTLNDYRFSDYIKVISLNDSTDLSGNTLTGTARNFFGAGVDAATRIGFYANVTLQHTGRIPLNDENTDFAGRYNIFNARLGFKKTWSRLTMDIFAGVDNAFDAQYSLGNDLNAIGGRYYNAAPTANYFAGVKASWAFNP
ncbi:MAG TPA: TonB-dependent receptor [Ohtaekwangia sp.]|nr:TonB-dependent receptor [Ohtaekwangia sp.]